MLVDTNIISPTHYDTDVSGTQIDGMYEILNTPVLTKGYE